MLITSKKLAKSLDDPNLLLVDCRSYKEYSQGHIPHAVNLDLFGFHWLDTSKKGLKSFNEQCKKILSFVGITAEKKIVFYDDLSGMLAARGVWLLLYFSHKNVLMLDGGIKKWQTEGLPVEQKTNGFSPSKFDSKINLNIITGYEYIVKNLEKLLIIDARSKEEYDGTIIRGARRGHIPNAINIDWNFNISEDGTFKDEKLLSKLYKFPKDAEIVTYCQGAYRAANSFLALKLLGFKNVKVYLGSWGEWSNIMDLPTE
jgi:thiosulfate/3-mercaptopyruvate sulfurtransferase